jgi:tetratricopeptide (TPR) repeat protein
MRFLLRLLSISLVVCLPLLANNQLIINKLIEKLAYTEEQANAFLKENLDYHIQFSNLSQEQKLTFNDNGTAANKLSKSGEGVEAYRSYTQCYLIFSHSGQINDGIGSSLYKLRLFKDSEMHYRRAVELDPLNPIFRYNLSESRFIQRDFKNALSNFEITEKLAENRDPKLIQIINLKRQLCYLELMNQAEGQEKVLYAKLFTDLNAECSKWRFDLLHYYSEALQEFKKSNDEAARRKIKNAFLVFPDSFSNEPFVDTLVELGYLSQIDLLSLF